MSTKNKNLLPELFVLYQNYPNPFNPYTILSYEIPKSVFVEITVYDLLGNVVKNLVNQKEALGFNLLEWDATNNQGQLVPAGVYLYSINAAEFSETKKMILLK